MLLMITSFVTYELPLEYPCFTKEVFKNLKVPTFTSKNYFYVNPKANTNTILVYVPGGVSRQDPTTSISSSFCQLLIDQIIKKGYKGVLFLDPYGLNYYELLSAEIDKSPLPSKLIDRCVKDLFTNPTEILESVKIYHALCTFLVKSTFGNFQLAHQKIGDLEDPLEFKTPQLFLQSLEYFINLNPNKVIDSKTEFIFYGTSFGALTLVHALSLKLPSYKSSFILETPYFPAKLPSVFSDNIPFIKQIKLLVSGSDHIGSCGYTQVLKQYKVNPSLSIQHDEAQIKSIMSSKSKEYLNIINQYLDLLKCSKIPHIFIYNSEATHIRFCLNAWTYDYPIPPVLDFEEKLT